MLTIVTYPSCLPGHHQHIRTHARRVSASPSSTGPPRDTSPPSACQRNNTAIHFAFAAAKGAKGGCRKELKAGAGAHVFRHGASSRVVPRTRRAGAAHTSRQDGHPKPRNSWRRGTTWDRNNFHRAFYNGLKSKVSLAAAKTAAMRINLVFSLKSIHHPLNISGCGGVAPPVHSSRPSPPRQPPCSQPPTPPRRSIV